jgi:hypothetical protein
VRSAGLGPIEVTEHVLPLHRRTEGKRWCPYGRTNLDGQPWTVAGRLAQARMWRQFAGAWDGIKIDRGFVGWPHGHRVVLGREWMEKVLRVSKRDCIRRARANHYLARRLRRLP